MDKELQPVAALLKSARRVLFITGAGVSAESGIPTFRGTAAAFADGRTEEGICFEEVLSGSTFRRTPALSWKYFFRLEQALRNKQPNDAHRAMASLQSDGRFVCVATQNIDGLHQAAGSKAVLELHGNLRRLVCTECEYQDNPATFEALPALPSCPQCGRLLRPDAVLYEEMLPEDVLWQFEVQQEKGFDLVFSVGTTSIFEYVIRPVVSARRGGIPTVEINPDETGISGLVDFRFASKAGPTLKSLLEAEGDV
jgi:NAD-dependent deacetylase